MGISTVLVLIMILLAVKLFGKDDVDVQKDDTGIKKWMANKWYIDELYQAVIIQPLHIFSVLLKNLVEKNIIDGAVNGVGRLVHYGARQFRLIQSGQVGNYLLFMILSIVVFILIWFNDATILRALNNIF
jgi:NADH-quinone oxidoreductase subunit L